MWPKFDEMYYYKSDKLGILRGFRPSFPIQRSPWQLDIPTDYHEDLWITEIRLHLEKKNRPKTNYGTMKCGKLRILQSFRPFFVNQRSPWPCLTAMATFGSQIKV